ncbi:MAG TPA: hypothetical protein VFH58_12640 [Acidimicrobiales bacterium]|nr:hypothetical protein [Acidimicrobiales bacterium]
MPAPASSLRASARALAVFLAAAIALVLWLWGMTQTSSRSVARYVQYWGTIAYVPGVLTAAYLLISRSVGRPLAVGLVLLLAVGGSMVLVWLVISALATLTF